ncbi:MAG TPA: DUF1329 domain-containing protein [Burkholderiaceae bacterium]|nr:DUF1329 domain-containing protein [Burkholderiaceae bacterium]
MQHFIKALAAAVVLGATLGHAAVTPEEVRQLGTSLTETGAEKSGNREGTIPAYTGGLTKPPAGFKQGSGIRPNPFADEKPKFSIDAKNMAQYAAQLSEGSQSLLQKYPSYRIDVYPTHRTVAYPKFVTDNTVKNAGKAKTTNEGRSITGAHAAIPFPIPKDGYEVMWNHLLHFNGRMVVSKYRNVNVDASGRATVASEGIAELDYPYWDTERVSDVYSRTRVRYSGPARRAGEALLLVDPLNSGAQDRRGWGYLPGQRRVRLAPDYAHDTPNPGTAGATTFDDTFVFNGSMDRFNFKLLGKKEMFVPYNAYAAVYQTRQDDLFKPNHLNPDVLRWELHRVWVVEATLREGKRHVYSKRRFYINEDSWGAVLSDEFDARGKIYRAGFALQAPSYDQPAPADGVWGAYDLATGVYTVGGYAAETGGLTYAKPLSEREWTADALAGTGVR